MTPIQKDFMQLWNTATLREEYVWFIDKLIDKVLPQSNRYRAVANDMNNGMPWWFVMIVHLMEVGGKENPFDYHLHCGDSLTGRTIHLPKGRPRFNPGHGENPPSRNNPYTWEESAKDALVNVMHYDKVNDWSLPNCLTLFEKYNGMGYRNRGINTPYVWSWTNHYGIPPNTGKYVADGRFEIGAISKQCGCAAFLIRLKERDLISVF